MEYFNQIKPEYLYCLTTGKCVYKVKLEILTYYETVIGEIIKDIPTSAQGQININYQQLIRRSCNISLANVDLKYTPNQNKWFWLDRKFKLWVGVKTTDNTFWFSQGIFVTNNASGDSHLLNIEGVDKGCFLDGSLQTNKLDGNYVIETGSSIKQLIHDTLLLCVGSRPIDPIPPLIDLKFNKIKTETEITINDGEYIGSLFSQIADGYGADVFYDIEGRLSFVNSIESNGVNAYGYMSSLFDFSDVSPCYSESMLQYNYECYNAVTVYTNISAKDKNGESIDNVSYTAYNTNPKSPLNISNVGIRRMDSVEVAYIDNLTQEKMRQRCKEYAEYLLKKVSMQQLSVQFSSIIIPHLDVNKIITITDATKELNAERFVVQSIVIPLSSAKMNIQATNITVLP